MVRDAIPDDVGRLEAIATSTEMFSDEELRWFRAEMDAWARGERPGHRWGLSADGAAYLTPDEVAGEFNLRFIGVLPEARGRGQGADLLAWSEERARASGGHLLRIDTSGQERFAPARALYVGSGYRLAEHVPDHWGPGDAKVSYVRELA